MDNPRLAPYQRPRTCSLTCSLSHDRAPDSPAEPGTPSPATARPPEPSPITPIRGQRFPKPQVVGASPAGARTAPLAGGLGPPQSPPRRQHRASPRGALGWPAHDDPRAADGRLASDESVAPTDAYGPGNTDCVSPPGAPAPERGGAYAGLGGPRGAEAPRELVKLVHVAADGEEVSGGAILEDRHRVQVEAGVDREREALPDAAEALDDRREHGAHEVRDARRVERRGEGRAGDAHDHDRLLTDRHVERVLRVDRRVRGDGHLDDESERELVRGGVDDVELELAHGHLEVRGRGHGREDGRELGRDLERDRVRPRRRPAQLRDERL